MNQKNDTQELDFAFFVV